MPVFELPRVSFNAGLWSKKLDARSDLERYPAACSELINFLPHAYGGLSNRAGTEFVFSFANKKVRLIPFQFNAEQAYVLALYEGGGVIAKDGGVILDSEDNVYTFTHPYAEEHLKGIQHEQSADVLYLVHSKYPPASLTRTAHDSWTYNDLPFENEVPTPPAPTVEEKSTTGDTYKYGITFVKNDIESILVEADAEAHLGDIIKWGHIPEYYDVDKVNVYRYDTGSGYFGWVGNSISTGWVDINEGGTLPDMKATPPIMQNPFVGEGNYPSAVCIHQGRLVFAGTDNNPRVLYGSCVGSYTNFAIRSPLQASDSYEFEPSSGEVNRIEWLRSFSDALIIGSGGGIFAAKGTISPNEVDIVLQNNYGVAPIPSVVAGDDILYIQRGKNIIRSLQYNALSELYEGDNVSMLSEDLITGHRITSIAWQRDPEYVLWGTRDDGVLLGLTYVKKEKVFAWHKHVTDGKFVDIAVINDETGEDKLYTTVERDGVYCIEKFKSRELLGDINNSWFLDSAIEYEGDPKTTFLGLDHLEGKTVSVFSEGSVLENLTVSNGSITIPFPVESAVVGLPYTSSLETMEVSMPLNSKQSLSSITRIASVAVYTQDSCRMSVSGTGGENEVNWQSLLISSSHDIDAPYSLRSGKFKCQIQNSNPISDGEVQRHRIYVKNKLPLPATVCAIGITVEVGSH